MFLRAPFFPNPIMARLKTKTPFPLPVLWKSLKSSGFFFFLEEGLGTGQNLTLLLRWTFYTLSENVANS